MSEPEGKMSENDFLTYVPLAKAHLPLLLPIEHEAYPDPWTQGMFLQEIRNGASHFFLAFEGEALVAYGGFWLLIDEIHITKLTVATSHRRRGLGAALMGYLEAHGQQVGGTTVRLEVRESNTAARTLYARGGFQEIGIRKKYYAATGENAVVMVKHLLPHDPGHAHR